MNRISIPILKKSEETGDVSKAQKTKQWAAYQIQAVSNMLSDVSRSLAGASKTYLRTPRTGGMSFNADRAKLTEAIRMLQETEDADVNFDLADTAEDVSKAAGGFTRSEALAVERKMGDCVEELYRFEDLSEKAGKAAENYELSGKIKHVIVGLNDLRKWMDRIGSAAQAVWKLDNSGDVAKIGVLPKESDLARTQEMIVAAKNVAMGHMIDMNAFIQSGAGRNGADAYAESKKLYDAMDNALASIQKLRGYLRKM